MNEIKLDIEPTCMIELEIKEILEIISYLMKSEEELRGEYSDYDAAKAVDDLIDRLTKKLK